MDACEWYLPSLRESLPHHIDSRNYQTVKLDSKCLYLLSHLPGSFFTFLILSYVLEFSAVRTFHIDREIKETTKSTQEDEVLGVEKVSFPLVFIPGPQHP